MHDDETLRPIFSAGQCQWSWQLISGRHRWWNQMSWSAIFFFVSADRRLYVLWVSATLISADSDSDTHNRWSALTKRKALTKTKIADQRLISADEENRWSALTKKKIADHFSGDDHWRWKWKFSEGPISANDHWSAPTSRTRSDDESLFKHRNF